MALSEKWKSTVNDAITNRDWDAYDDLIRRELKDYGTRFASFNPGANWKLVKAMVWTESGGPKSPAWKGRVMQIGNRGDKGYATLKKGGESTNLILSDEVKRALVSGNVNTPSLNVQLGIAYLFVRMSNSDLQSVDDTKDTAIHEYTVVAGDSFDKIASHVGTTIAVLQELNPDKKVLHPKDVIKYRKAAIKRVLKGFLPFTTKNVAHQYNGGGDADYADKLEYCVSLMDKLKR